MSQMPLVAGLIDAAFRDTRDHLHAGIKGGFRPDRRPPRSRRPTESLHAFDQRDARGAQPQRVISAGAKIRAGEGVLGRGIATVKSTLALSSVFHAARKGSNTFSVLPRVSGPMKTIVNDSAFQQPTMATTLHGEPLNVRKSQTASAGSVAPARRFAALYANADPE